MRKIALLPLTVLVFAALTRVAFAQIVFTEIMYDPEGSDTGREWVEITNQGSSAVDLSQCKAKALCRFIEAGNNHELTVVAGSPMLSPGAYAIVADNAQIFLSDHPGYGGVVVDSSFSLKNSGETIAFKMPDGSIGDTVVYTPDMGASGDGNTLQKIDGVWKGAVATPGAASLGAASYDPKPINSQTNTVTTATPETQTATAGINLSSFPVEPQIFTDAGPQSKTVSVGAPVTLSGRVWGLKKEPIDNARMTWAFGDGGTADGATVSHIYYYPGEYTAVLDAASGFYSASDRVRIMAVAPSLSLHTGGDATRSFVSLENFGNDELDLSEWQVMSGAKIFTLPKNTFIAAHKILTIASEVSGLNVATSTATTLRFPNGTLVPPPGTIGVQEVKAVQNNFEPAVQATEIVQKRAPRVSKQTANTLDAFSSESNSVGEQQQPGDSSLWAWYAGVALIGVLAAVGLRLGRKKEHSGEVSADDFKIIEETDGDA